MSDNSIGKPCPGRCTLWKALRLPWSESSFKAVIRPRKEIKRVYTTPGTTCSRGEPSARGCVSVMYCCDADCSGSGWLETTNIYHLQLLWAGNPGAAQMQASGLGCLHPNQVGPRAQCVERGLLSSFTRLVQASGAQWL